MVLCVVAPLAIDNSALATGVFFVNRSIGVVSFSVACMRWNGNGMGGAFPPPIGVMMPRSSEDGVAPFRTTAERSSPGHDLWTRSG